MLVKPNEVINNEKFVEISNNLNNLLYDMGCSHIDLEEFELDYWNLGAEFELFYSFSLAQQDCSNGCDLDYDECMDQHMLWFINRFYFSCEGEELIDLAKVEEYFKEKIKPVNCDNCCLNGKYL